MKPFFNKTSTLVGVITKKNHRPRPPLASVIFFIFFSIFCCQIANAQTDSPLKVLIVTAHPDDESGEAATIYKLVHDLGAKVDLCLVTNGEGGYKYATLAEAYYGLELTNEKIGRQYLPAIRKQELMNAGKVLGIRNYFFLDQVDDKYDLDERDPLDTVWDVPYTKRRMTEIMTKGHYDYVFNMLPVPSTHAGHKASGILSLQVIQALPADNRPIVLGMGFLFTKEDSAYVQLKNYKETRINKDAPVFKFDKTMKFGYKGALDYRLVTQWDIAEHKTQGSTQMGGLRQTDRLAAELQQGKMPSANEITMLSAFNYETFFYYDMNPKEGIAKTQALFDKLKVNRYKVKVY